MQSQIGICQMPLQIGTNWTGDRYFWVWFERSRGKPFEWYSRFDFETTHWNLSQNRRNIWEWRKWKYQRRLILLRKMPRGEINYLINIILLRLRKKQTIRKLKGSFATRLGCSISNMAISIKLLISKTNIYKFPQPTR